MCKNICKVEHILPCLGEASEDGFRAGVGDGNSVEQ